MAKRPRDPNQLAKMVVDISIGEAEDTAEDKKQQRPKRGRAGGLKGGKARAKVLTRAERIAISRKAALARWRQKRK